MKRACADCEQELGILDRTDTTKTHGQCLRHFVGSLLQSGIAWADVADGIKEVNAGKGFCPDLKSKGKQ